jgi:small-conductance mechanosensitive channel
MLEQWLGALFPDGLGPEWIRVLSTIVVVVGALVLRKVVLRVLQGFFATLIRRTDSAEQQRRIETLGRVARHTLSLLIVVVTGLVVLNTLGISIAPILGAAGVAGVAIGFGAQSLVKDFFSGVFLLLENQIRVGDVVEVAGKTGVVEGMTLRRTQLRAVDGAVHYVSNGLITTVTNFSTEFAYAVVDVSIAYKEDLDHVFHVMRTTAAELKAAEPFTKTVIGDLEILGVDQWAESAVIVRCRMKTQPLQQWAARREFLKRLKRAFEDAGISIPFPHRLLVQDNAEPRPMPPTATAPPAASRSTD